MKQGYIEKQDFFDHRDNYQIYIKDSYRCSLTLGLI